MLVTNWLHTLSKFQNGTAGAGAEDVGGHQAGLGQGAERPNRNPSQVG